MIVSRQVLVVDAVEVDGISLGVARFAAVRLCKLYQAYPPDDKDKTDKSRPDVVDSLEFHCVTSKPFAVIVNSNPFGCRKVSPATSSMFASGFPGQCSIASTGSS